MSTAQLVILVVFAAFAVFDVVAVFLIRRWDR
jgi:hypothetical protein